MCPTPPSLEVHLTSVLCISVLLCQVEEVCDSNYTNPIRLSFPYFFQAHPIAKRRMVPDRSDGFDTMLAAHRAARKNVERRDSGPTLETIDKARSEGDKLPTQPHTSLPITSCTLQRPPTPLPSVDTPPSNEIQFRYVTCWLWQSRMFVVPLVFLMHFLRLGLGRVPSMVQSE